MCESNAYIINKDGKEELLMENVDYVKLNGGTILLRTLFGEEKTISGTIREMNLSGHRIVLERS
ncbi:MAG: CooT family nickel-binding protein [Deltaproteobacteria bacterium]|nr:CooT family nickel-binding protein [Deltaproteobacteria bacterium]